MIVTRQGSRALVQPRARNLNYPPLRFIVIRSEHFHEYNTSTCPLTQRTNQLGIWHTHTTLLYCAYAVKYRYLPTYQVEFTEHNAKVYTLVIPSLYAARMQSCLKVDV